MKKRKKGVPAKEPYYWTDNVHRFEELEYNGEPVKAGDQIRIARKRGTFTYRCWYHNSEKDVQWIDCIDNKTGQFRAYYIEDLKTVIRPKRSRAKKSKK